MEKILENKSYEQLMREHDEHTGRAKVLADIARANFMRPAYAGTVAEVKRPHGSRVHSTKIE